MLSSSRALVISGSPAPMLSWSRAVLLSCFRKQQQVEDLIRILLKNLEDLALHHREALTAYLDGNLAECEQRAQNPSWTTCSVKFSNYCCGKL